MKSVIMRQGSRVWFHVRCSQEEVDSPDGIARAIIKHWYNADATRNLRQALDLDNEDDDVEAVLDTLAQHIYVVACPDQCARDATKPSACFQLDWYRIPPMQAACVVVYRTYGTYLDVLGHTSWRALWSTSGMVYLDRLQRDVGDALLLPWEAMELYDLTDTQRLVLEMDQEMDTRAPQEWCWYIPWCPSQTGSQTPPHIRGDNITVSMDQIVMRLLWMQKSAARHIGIPDGDPQLNQYLNTADMHWEPGSEPLWEWWDTCVSSSPDVPPPKAPSAAAKVHAACPSGLTPLEDMHAQVVCAQLFAVVRLIWPGMGHLLYDIMEDIEYELWDWRMTRLCTNETAVYTLAAFNGLDTLLEPVEMNDETLTINQHRFIMQFMHAIGSDSTLLLPQIPSLYFSVPYEDAPEEADGVLAYPLQPGGRAHLDYAGISRWMLQHQQRFFTSNIGHWAYQVVLPYARIETTKQKGKKDIDTLHLNPTEVCVSVCDGHYKDLFRTVREMARYWDSRCVNKRAKKEYQGPDVSLALPPNMTTNHFLYMSPPCIQRVMHTSHQPYPKFQQCQMISREIYNAKMPIRVAEMVFVDVARRHHDIDNGCSVDDARQSYDWSWTWKKDYRSKTCIEYMDNALNKTIDNTQFMCCPMTERVCAQNRQQGIRATRQEIYQASYAMCTQNFIQRFPNQYRPDKTLKYPFQWYIWFLLRGGNFNDMPNTVVDIEDII